MLRAALMRGLTSRRAADDRCLRARRDRRPGGLRQRGHGRDRRPARPRRPAAAGRPGPERHREGRQLVELDPSTSTSSEDEKSRPTLDAFTKATGIKVNYTEDYNDNDEFYAKVRPLLDGGEDTGRDVWCSTDWMVARLIRQGYVQKLDTANIPNVAATSRTSLKNVEFDPGRLYSLPVAERLRRHRATTSTRPAARRSRRSTQLLTDPALKGKVTLLTEMRDTVGPRAVRAWARTRPTSPTPTSTPPSAMLQKAKDAGQIKGFTGNDYTDGLTKGDIAACVAWTGDVVQLQFDERQGRSTRCPQAGFTLWSDNFVIPALAKHKKNAETLINYYYDPAVMARGRGVGQLHPAGQGHQGGRWPRSTPRPPTTRSSSPRAEVLSRAKVFRGLSAEEETKYNQRLLRPHRQLMARRTRPATSGWSGSPSRFGDVHRGPPPRPAPSRRGRSSPCSARRGAARRRPCGWSPASRSPTAGQILHRRHRHHRHHAPTSATSTRCSSRYALFPHMSVMRQRRLRPAAPWRQGRQDARRRTRSTSSSSGTPAARSRTSSPAACSSASRWPAPWSTAPTCCCSTSRSVRSTSSCAARCRSSSSASSRRSASPSSTSPTTRRRP